MPRAKNLPVLSQDAGLSEIGNYALARFEIERRYGHSITLSGILFGKLQTRLQVHALAIAVLDAVWDKLELKGRNPQDET